MSLPFPDPSLAVLFDCDGVLADSEHLVDILVAEELGARGWTLTPEEAGRIFLGKSLPDMVPIIEARLGPLPADWPATFAARVAWTMERQVPPIPGAPEAVAAVRAAGLPVAVASNSGRAELIVKLRRLGLTEAFAGRVFSFQDVPRPKPHPDIYLAAAAACGVAPARCAVIEDSAVGARAGVAAGCRVLGFCRDTDPAVLRAAGASAVFRDMAELPALLGLEAVIPERPVQGAPA
ncbi:HAD family hydrolase [Roseomonas sp. BN140053]|uniref:HAD family hydrolase n=1 Tax=Roseomonas sp. BN140053 TaxID=3391898 RepID=UPI0039E829B6